MCNLKSLTKLKKVIGYKLAYKEIINNVPHYYSWMYKAPVTLGDVKSCSEENLDFLTDAGFYNHFLEGKSSCFKRLEAVQAVVKHERENRVASPVILKIEYSGAIAIGDALNISMFISFNEVIYAGSFIESIQEIDLSGKVLYTVELSIKK